MKIIPFTDEQKEKIFARARLNMLSDKNLDDSTKVVASLFLALKFTDGEPRGLVYSVRELGKKFGKSHMMIQRSIKRLETFGYIKIEDFKDRRKLYIPLQKLTGIPDRYIEGSGGDLRNITLSDEDQARRGTNQRGTNDLNSKDYTLYDILNPATSYSPRYAELPLWKDIESPVSARLKEKRIHQTFLNSFKTYYTSHPIPLERIYDIINTFAIARHSQKIKKSSESYLRSSFERQEKEYKNENLQKIEENQMKEEKKALNQPVEAEMFKKQLTSLAYMLNTDKKVVADDLPKTLVNLWEDTGKVSIDADGFIKRSENVLFYVKDNTATIFTATIYDIPALKRLGVEIPGILELTTEQVDEK